MTTLPSPAVKPFPLDSIEKKAYDIAESFAEYIPIANDRNRLGFNIYRLLTKDGDSPAIIVKNTKIKVVGISLDELAKMIEKKIA